MAGGEITIPETFEIAIPVFEGLNAPLHTLQCRLRWRVDNKAVKMSYELVRPHKVVEQAFADLLAEITEGAGKQVLFGSPE